MIHAGKLRDRVTVQQATETRNSLGEVVQSWSTYATVWASVEGISSREALQQGQVQTDVSHRVQMRFLSGLTHNMRLYWRARTLEIVSVLEHGNRSEHEILCTEAL